MKTKPPKDELILEAIDNLRSDRKITEELLLELRDEIINTNYQTTHANAGHVAAKYVETLQRSNEQLVKLVSLYAKDKAVVDEKFSKEEKDNIFELIKESA